MPRVFALFIAILTCATVTQGSVPIVVGMIMASSKEERISFLERLKPLQKADFKRIFIVMEGLPVIVRLLDPPLHEFLPSLEDLLAEIARCVGVRKPAVKVPFPIMVMNAAVLQAILPQPTLDRLRTAHDALSRHLREPPRRRLYQAMPHLC